MATCYKVDHHVGSCHSVLSKHDLTATFLILNRQFGRYSPELDGLISIKLSPDFPVIRRILAGSSCSESPQAEDSRAGTRAPSAPGGVSLPANGSACSAAAALSALLPPPPEPDCCITSPRPRGRFGRGVAPHRRPIAECSRDRARCTEMFRF